MPIIPRVYILIIFLVCTLAASWGVSVASVSGEGKRDKEEFPIGVLPENVEQLAPLEARKIEEAGERLGNRVEAAGKRASLRYGGWLNAQPFLGISWLKLLLCLALAALTFTVERVLRHWMKSRLRKLQAEDQEFPLKALLLRSLLNPLSLFVLVYGVYFSLSPLFVHFQNSHRTNLVQSLATKAADLGGIVSVVWFFYGLVHLLDGQLRGIPWSRNGMAQACLRHCRGPLKLLVVLFLARLLVPLTEAIPVLYAALANAFVMVLIGCIAWLLVGIANVAEEVVLGYHKIDVRDNLTARRVHTQIRYIKRMVVAGIVLIALASMLMVFDKVRQLGTGLLASAGIAGIVVGLAAQRTLANLLTGLQIALTQPIRMDDVVVLENEFGRVEEITSTYVVVRLWDLRRLVLPLTYFTEKPFQNWTRTSSDLLGAVHLHVDYRMSVDPLRRALRSILESSPFWDGKVGEIQVTDSTKQTIELRALASASDASSLWNLRCEIREGLITFMQENHPDCLPRVRVDLGGGDDGPDPSPPALRAPVASR